MLPSETQYALSGDATQPDVIERARALKGRGPSAPFSVFFHGLPALADWGIRLPAWALPLTQHFWPGPLTLVLPLRNRLLRRLGSDDTVGVRVSSEPLLRRLGATFGKPLLATSANPSGARLTVAQENAWLRRLAETGAVKWARPSRYVRRPASTVLDCTGSRPRQLRPGAVPESAWRAIIRGI